MAKFILAISDLESHIFTDTEMIHRNIRSVYFDQKKKKMAEENEIHFASGCHFLTVQGNDLLLVNIPEIREVLVLSCYCTHTRKRYVLSHLSTT